MKRTLELEKIIKEHYASLYSVALHFVGSPDIAGDITQTVLMKLWEKNKTFEIESLDNYLFTLAKNESLNYLRGNQRESKRYQKIDYPVQEDPVILNLLIEEETNQILVEAINRLPLQSARIMRFVLSGYEHKEIALIMGVSLNTVKTLKYGAIRKLREYLINKKWDLNRED